MLNSSDFIGAIEGKWITWIKRPIVTPACGSKVSPKYFESFLSGLPDSLTPK
jgi:hypothetical protein